MSDPFGTPPSQEPPPPGDTGQWGTTPPQAPPPPPGYGSAPPQYGAPPPQYGYGPPPGPYGYGYPQETESQATTALVLSIVGVFTCFIVSIVALVIAGKADESIRQSGGRKTGEGLVKAARIVSWITIGLTVLGILVVIVVVAVAAPSST